MISLWQALDEALAGHLLLRMGEDSGYDDLQVMSAEIGDTWKPAEIVTPAILIVANDAGLDHGPHGGGGPHVEAAYQYTVVAVADADTWADAKRAAQTLHGRLLAALREWPIFLGLAQTAAGDGATADQVAWDRSWIEVRSAPRARYWAIAVARFEVQATI